MMDIDEIARAVADLRARVAQLEKGILPDGTVRPITPWRGGQAPLPFDDDNPTGTDGDDDGA